MTSTNSKRSQAKQFIVISVSSTVMIVVLTLVVWLYNSSKKDSLKAVENRMRRIEKIIDGLSNIKKKELSTLSVGIASRPLIKSALKTKHKKTIEDVLKSVLDKNDLDFIIILENKVIRYFVTTVKPEILTLKSIASGKFIGQSKINVSSNSNYTLMIGGKLDDNDLKFWSEISNAKFKILNSINEVVVSNVDRKDLTNENLITQGVINVTSDNKYYFREIHKLGKSLKIRYFIDKKYYSDAFVRKKNQLLLIGGSLLFLGILLSLFVAEVIIKIFNKGTTFNPEAKDRDFEALITEIEGIKKKLI